MVVFALFGWRMQRLSMAKPSLPLYTLPSAAREGE